MQRSDNPRVVLLSPGPRSPSYFEDAYLARYLGYTLVEGGDLTVRGTNVYLKTLGGLLPVDVILRRMHDEEADPLELRVRLDVRRGRTGRKPCGAGRSSWPTPWAADSWNRPR